MYFMFWVLGSRFLWQYDDKLDLISFDLNLSQITSPAAMGSFISKLIVSYLCQIDSKG